MIRAFAVLCAIVLAGPGAVAASFQFKNCGPSGSTVTGFDDDGVAFDRATSTSIGNPGPGGIVLVSCYTAGCRIEVTYQGPAPGEASIARFRGPYSTDRCTRGIEDRGTGELPAAGACGC
ncbi:MAG: hypothetical protein AB7O45_12285 [Alphaproteobacteria bacterium]